MSSPSSAKKSRTEPNGNVAHSEDRFVKGTVDPDLPLDTATGKVYHLGCTRDDIADLFIVVGDPARVAVVAARFDKGSITFDGSHREINIMTGTYKGVRVTCLSTGMGTDNVEIVMNEIHALKEYNVATRSWAEGGAANAGCIKLIRVGTCGSPHADAAIGTLAITRHGIGMDNTCRYYEIPHTATTTALEAIANATALSKAGGIYATSAHPAVTAAIVKAAASLPSGRPHMVGITASGSGFYGCQGRVVGRFKGKVTVPNLVDLLGTIALPIPGEAQPERVVNIEMENSALCTLSNILGYKAGTVCAIIAKRAGDIVEFATPDEAKLAITDAITAALEALITIE